MLYILQTSKEYWMLCIDLKTLSLQVNVAFNSTESSSSKPFMCMKA